ncbi:MAG TPA: nicotinate-nucleotide adenylyltransferase [Anaerolineaceae bacterium]|jgi:nicotinate-nucleotide adenylyltransferase
MRVGIFGGTFDPPHLGHLILSEEAQYQLEIDRMLWVLTADPPHKHGLPITRLEDRLALVHAAIDDNPSFELSRIDIDRPGPHFALDTVRLIGAQFPEAELYYLIGGDSLRDLPAWHCPQDLLRSVKTLGVMRRPGDEIDLTTIEEQVPGVSAKVHFVDAPLLEISSSQIRARAAEGKPYRYYLPEAVFNLVQSLQLYR